MSKKKQIIRQAEFRDAEAIFTLVKKYPKELLARPIGDIVENIDRFMVCEIKGKIAAAVSWQILPEIGKPHQPSVEIKSLAVSTRYRNIGIGKALVTKAIEKIKGMNPTQIIALTFKPDFFFKLGFKVVPKETLVHKIYAGCINCTKYDSPFTCPEVAVAMSL